jgi:hypothetical protein
MRPVAGGANVKAVINSLDEIDEALQAEYEEQNGKFVLKIEGDHPSIAKVVLDANEKVTAAQRDAKKQVAEFRDNNVALLKLLGAEGFDDAKAKIETFKSIDPDEYQKAKTRIQELEAKGVTKGEDIQALVQKQVAAAVAPYEKKLREQEEQRAAEAQQYARAQVEQALTQAAVKAGVAESAIEDFVSRGSKVFHFDNGKVIAKDGDEVVFSKRRPADPLDVLEWAEDLQGTAPHIFKPSGGGGAAGDDDAGGAGTRYVNSFDPMEIGRNLEGIASGEVKVNQG